MKPDNIAIIHSLEPRTVKVWLCGDVHVGAEGCQLDAWEKWLASLMEDPDAYVIFVGDLMDNVTRTSVGSVFAPMPPSEQLEVITRALRPLSEDGRILALVAGNHCLRSARDVDMDPLYTVCVRLGIENLYRRDFAAIRVKMGRTQSCARAFNLLAFHGACDAKVRQMANNVEGFDVLLTGHTHQPVTRIPAHLCLNRSGKVVMKEIIQATACSWCDYVGYAARGMYQPQVQSRPQCLILEWDSSQTRDKHITVSW